MKKKDEFYIGWKDEVPESYKRFGMIMVSSIAVLVVIVTTIWVSISNHFADSLYDIGNETIYEGVIYEYPAPMIVVTEQDTVLSIPFVNAGKFGVSEPIKYFKSQMRNNLLNYKVKLRGTKIEFDGKTWLELTRENGALLSFEKLEEESAPRPVEMIGRAELTGEIVDPKCFFGAMKPGYGKTHLSCAVRCISGGMPPILVVPEEDGNRSYYFVTGRSGKDVNDEILPFVGIPVKLSGIVKKVDGWDVVEIVNEDDVSLAGTGYGVPIFSNCGVGEGNVLLAENE